jgi:hypothetical protein
MRKMRKEREETHTYIVVSETSLGRSSFLILNKNSLLLRYGLEERVRKLGCLISILMFEMLISNCSLLLMNQILLICLRQDVISDQKTFFIGNWFLVIHIAIFNIKVIRKIDLLFLITCQSKC